MKSQSTNNFVFQILRKVYLKISNAGYLYVPKVKYLFKPNNEISFQTQNTSINVNYSKHSQRPNTHPVVEKQTLIKEKLK